jgi:hypothetical protein
MTDTPPPEHKGVVIGAPESFGWMDTGKATADGYAIWERPDGKLMFPPLGDDIYIAYDANAEEGQRWRWLPWNEIAEDRKPRPRPLKRRRPGMRENPESMMEQMERHVRQFLAHRKKHGPAA